MEYPLGIALQSNGKIILVGVAEANSYDLDFDIMVLRFNPNGTMDMGFNGGGKAIMNLGSKLDVLYGLAIQSDGKIVATGRTGYPDGQVAILRFNINGTLDQNFGNLGMVTRNITPHQNDEAYSVHLQEDGKILVGGYSGDGRMALLRYMPDGTKAVSSQQGLERV